jgi:catechol 2,3-dioxygenase-like lactoylglutathione lyase family enzyme
MADGGPEIDVGLSHVALPVSDLDASLEFYRRFANLEVVHRREEHPGHGVAWISDLTRPFVVVLLQSELPAAGARLGGWAHLGVGCLSRAEVDRRLSEAAAAGYEIVGPCDDGPPVGYWGIIVDPDGHNLELAFGQQAGLAVADAD